MVALRDAPEMQALMRAIADATEPGHDPASAAAAMSGVDAEATSASPVERQACLIRRGRPGDEPGLARLIVEGNLPPFFIEPFLAAFLVVEHEGDIIGCGCAEMYDESSVIRSVVVSTRARGLGLGLEIARLLEEDARLSGARDLYLFTLDAWRFWQRLGYTDIPLDSWYAPARENWQYQFISQFPDAVKDVHVMGKSA
jgi:amino-acid N-acetyltransferase